MAQRRVFVIWSNPLFHDSAQLLLKHPDIVWVGSAKDFSSGYDAIMTYKPDTILFEKTKSGIPVEVLEILEMESWDIRVIGFSLDNNELSLYHREHQLVVQAGDLLQFVLG